MADNNTNVTDAEEKEVETSAQAEAVNENEEDTAKESATSEDVSGESEETLDEETGDEASESEEAGEPESKENNQSGESFFEKVKNKKANKKNDALNEKIEALEDRVKRQMAEFENFRKRTDKEKSQMFENGAKSVVEKILPVVDNFERGLSGLTEEQAKEPFAEGMSRIYKQLITELDNMGVKPIEAVGKEFDPNFHNAVMQCESEEYESGIVAAELQKGYMYKDSVVRHSMVSVVS
ncbi:MAG: nucleotide exchange factor GrpE [Lachnospiraceae bacterium]|nr:nucleotide exchange factor GrpE [Lachnospiraceae bacterium]